MSAIRTIEVKVKTKRNKVLAILTLTNGTLKIDGTIDIASEALAMLAKHSAALPFTPNAATESEPHE